MCINPSHVWVKRGPKWEQTPVPCDRCKLCRENYVSDWVGRCLCEAATSQVSCTVSLTYAQPDDWQDLSHKIVTPLHFQLFIKRLRNAGHKIRYLVAGEYGETFDRSHFHAVLFFTDLRPSPDGRVPRLERAKHKADPSSCAAFCREIPQEEMVNISEWPHGHIVVDWSVTDKSVRYCVEYLHGPNKKNGWVSCSKKPALGAAWFAQKAAQNVDFDVLPSSFEYLPPGGKPGKKYLMTGATRRDYLNAITQARSQRPRMSKWVAKTFDKLERDEFIKQADTATRWPDNYFTDRQEPVEKTVSRIVWEDGIAEARADAMMARIASYWGFPDVEEFKAFAEAGGLDAHPEYEGRGPWYIPDRASAPDVAQRPSGTGLRPPTGYDRQGKPYWGDPENPPLPDAFRRPEPNEGGPSGDEEGLS